MKNFCLCFFCFCFCFCFSGCSSLRFEGATGKGQPFDVFSNEVTVDFMEKEWGGDFEKHPERFSRTGNVIVYNHSYFHPISGEVTGNEKFASIYLWGKDDVSLWVEKKWKEIKGKK